MNKNNALDASFIRQNLLREGWNLDVVVFDEIDSTNSEGKRRACGLKRPLLLIADYQSQGRGRQGHTFYSPLSTGLYMTIVVPTNLPLSVLALSTQMMAVAALRALQKNGFQLQIKWVNDLFLGSKKVAGILTETVKAPETLQVAGVVCGIGINLTTESFPEELQHTAGSLGAIDRNLLAFEITAEFLKMMKDLPDTSAWMGEYRNKSLVIGKALKFTMNEKLYQGIGKKIDDQGRLIVNLEDGTDLTLSSGEVSIVPVFS